MATTKPAPTTESNSAIVNATALAKNPTDILNCVTYKDERFEVRRNGEVIDLLGPRVLDKIVTFSDLVDPIRNGPRPDQELAADMKAILVERPFLDSKDVPEWPE